MSETVITKLVSLQGYRFRVEFDGEDIPDLLVDESKPVGEGLGPTPLRLLSTAIGHCLSSSLLYCLRRARVEVKSLETTVKTSTARNKEGRLRVKNIDVQISLGITEEYEKRLFRCLEIFENYCTVTSSIRKGIDVRLNVVSNQATHE